MSSFGVLVFGLFICASDAPSMRFAPCSGAKNLHIAVRPESDHSYLVHFHINIRSMSGQAAFVRLRCVVDDENGKEVVHTTMKEVPIESDEESWKFFLNTPRFPDQDPKKVTYQIEVGKREPSEIDEYSVFDRFSWRFKDGKMYVGTSDDPIYISIGRKVVSTENGKFTVRTVYSVNAQSTPLRFGVTDFDVPLSGTATAQRRD